VSFSYEFNWLKDEEIGELPKSWSWLAMEHEEKRDRFNSLYIRNTMLKSTQINLHHSIGNYFSKSSFKY
tara:strand:+ start:112 stop:318 length:207 start_codon:yes stop_codon:yes gene_type:complete